MVEYAPESIEVITDAHTQDPHAFRRASATSRGCASAAAAGVCRNGVETAWVLLCARLSEAPVRLPMSEKPRYPQRRGLGAYSPPMSAATPIAIANAASETAAIAAIRPRDGRAGWCLSRASVPSPRSCPSLSAVSSR